MQHFITIVTIVFFVNILLAMLIILFERRKPHDTLVWLMVLLFIPVLGFILYLFIGRDLSKKKLFVLKKEEEAILLKQTFSQSLNLSQKEISFKDQRTNNYSDTINLFLRESQSLFTEDNDVDIFADGNEKFAQLKKDILSAKKYIYIEYYIIREDGLGREIINLLAQKASEGLEVKLIYDGMGCIRVSKGFFDPLLNAGGKAVEFFPPTLPYVNLRVNFRNHRKLVVIDGSIGYVGGINIGDEYLGKSKKFGFWRDVHLKIVGSSVKDIEIRFLLDWRFASGEEVHLRNLLNTGTKSSYSGETGIQIVSSGPDSKWRSIRNGFLKIINNARNHIYIETPYFIPDESIFNALKVAALSGVDVRIIVPGISDHIFVYWAGLSYMGDLIEAGVRFYHYQNGFVHSKFVTADGFMSTVGTTNLDVRSFKVNFEINAFLYSEEKAGKLEEIFIDDMFDSIEMTPELYASRSFLTKTKESICRLFSPLL